MKWTVKLNEIDYFDIYLTDNDIRVDYHGLDLSQFIKFEYDNAYLNVYLFGQKIAALNLDKTASNQVVYFLYRQISNIEIRNMIQAIKNQANNQSIDIQAGNEVILRKDDSLQGYVSTELHTHFIEMLSGKDFLIVLSEFVSSFPVDKDGNFIGYLGVDEQGKRLSLKDKIAGEVACNDVAKLEKLAFQLEVPLDGQQDFMSLSTANSKRANLIDYVANYLKDNKFPDTSIGDIKAIIFARLLTCSINKLKENGVEYVELSYSNDSTIKKIITLLGVEDTNELGFRFLLSANRNSFHNPTYVRETKKNLRKLLEQGKVRGFDLMGEEKPLSEADWDINSDTSLAGFLNDVIPLLNKFPNSLLRLHMGENVVSRKNPTESLRLIDEIVSRQGLVLPPPFIRIGHGLHFYVNEEQRNLYIQLLRKYNVMVEINASSNFSLSNVEKLEDIPYLFYRNNGIPIVLATDGGGMYHTTPNQEGNVAYKVDRDIPEWVLESQRRRGIR